jgi:transposase
MIGFDEAVLSPASRRRRRRFVTAVADVETAQILDVFEGRDAKDLRAWMARQPKARLAGVEVVSVDPHEGHRSAILAPNPDTNTPSPLAEVTVVVDPFHIVRLANAAVTKTRPQAPAARCGTPRREGLGATPRRARRWRP